MLTGLCDGAPRLKGFQIEPLLAEMKFYVELLEREARHLERVLQRHHVHLRALIDHLGQLAEVRRDEGH